MIPIWTPRGWAAILGGKNSSGEGTQKTEGWQCGRGGAGDGHTYRDGREGTVGGHCQVQDHWPSK